jgi:parallel beta-helix repeat protein
MRAARSIFLLPLILGSLASAAAAAEIRVPRDHARIQDAVNAAGAGDVILVSKGTYAEDVVVQSRNDLTIQGRGKVLLKPETTGIAIRNSARITVRGIGVSGGEDGFEITESQDVTLQSFVAANVSHDGVSVIASSNVRLQTGRVVNCDNDGVSMGGSGPGQGVTGGEVTRVKAIRGGEDGIEVVGADVVVSRCTVTNVDDDGFEAAIEGAGPVRFEKCKSRNAESDGFDLATPNSTAVDCTATGSGDDGFDLEASNSRLERCKATGGRERGFTLELVTGVTLISCTATRNREAGFDVVGSTNSTIESCVARKSGTAGFALDSDSTGNTLTGNKASKSFTFDLHDDSPDGSNTFTNNKFKTIGP